MSAAGLASAFTVASTLSPARKVISASTVKLG
jgi:hypothetical protein